MPKHFSDPEAIAEDIIRDVGTNLVVGLPLGLGKANHIINALYARAVADRRINLTFFSALTLEKPKPSNLLERRFIAPVIDRLFGGYPDLAYADALHAGALPPNVQVIEFFFLAGQVAARAVRAATLHFGKLYPRFVLSAGARAQCRPATGRQTRGRWRRALQSELQHRHHAGCAARPRAKARAAFKLVGQVNSELPFMPGAGDLPAERIQRGAGRSGDRISAVRAAVRADHRHQICHRSSRRGPGARRRHACRSASARSAMRWRKG